MIERRPRRFLNGELEEKVIDDIDLDILPVVQALRERGVDTWASCSGTCDKGYHTGWGAYVQICLQDQQHVDSLVRFSVSVTTTLQERLSPQAELQLVSAEAWFSDPNTRSMRGPMGVPIFRLQLSGLNEDDYGAAWQIVRDTI